MSPKTIINHGVPRQIPGRGPNGRRFCRWCHNEVPKGRSSYCDNECRKHADFNYSKILCVHRDERKCRFCGIAGRYHYWPRDRELPKLEVDHIIAVRDGGSHHTDNLRTLCRECHRVRTKEQRARKEVPSE